MKKLKSIFKSKLFKSVLSGVLIASMVAGALPAAALSVNAQTNSEDIMEEFERQEIIFNQDWKFIRQDVEGAQAADFDDTYWYNVGLPHDFSIPYWQEESHYTGYGWYRKTFTVGPEWEGKRLFLDFDGVFHTAELYVNGEYVGTHRGGYTGFEFDITDYVNQGENVVAVRVNNIWDPTLAPRSGEHMFTGGIYRDVNLVVTSPVHVTWYGTFVQTPDVSAEEANVRMQVEVQNDSSSDKNVKVISYVYDADDKEVLSIESSQRTLAAGEMYNFDDTSEMLENPHLWSVDDPYMYKVLTYVYVDGACVDQFESPLGFRWFEWTSDEGFFLNGEHLWIDGVNAHQDHAGWANAVTTAALKRDVAMIKEAGFNFIRGSHYPHSPAYAEACDEMGILFWSEACFWSTSAWGEGTQNGTSDDYLADGYPTVNSNGEQEAFEQSCMDMLYEMIRINRNHPSIIVWSMGNEQFFGDNHDLKKALISKMAAYAKELDPTRPTAMGGTQRGGYDKLENVDIAGYNGDGAEMPEYQDPGVPNMVSEYSTHTQNRPGEFSAFWGSVMVDENGDPIEYEWRSGQALWCALHHGSILSRSYGDMGIIDYYRLPLQQWYYYRYRNTGVEPEQSSEGTATRLSIEASDETITDDGTQDTHLIVTVEDDNGTWLNDEIAITLEVIDGPGIFPTGKTMEFVPGDSMRDGKCAIEFRSYYPGVTTIRASADGLEPAEIQIATTGEEGRVEPDISTMYGSFMSGGNVPNPIEEAEPYAYINYYNVPMTASSGTESRLNILDGDLTTEWVADEPGSGQYLRIELEHGGMSLYKAKLSFNGTVYPYTISYKELNLDEPEWKTLVSYDGETIKTRPVEETFYGEYMRFLRIEFTDVPEDEYANLAEIELYGIRSEPDGFKTGYMYLSDLGIPQDAKAQQDAAYDGDTLRVDSTTYQKGIGTAADSDIVFDLEGDAAGYARFRCTVGVDSGTPTEAQVTVRVYGDGQLMYEKDIDNKNESFDIDLSIKDVKQLQLSVSGNNSNVYVDWADAKLIGAIRDISKDPETIEASYFAGTETIVAGQTYEAEIDFNGVSTEAVNIAGMLTLYNADGSINTAEYGELSIQRNGKGIMRISMDIPSDAEVGSYTSFIAWNKDTLSTVCDEVTASRVTGDPEKDKYQPAQVAVPTGYWANITGDMLTKSNGWAEWDAPQTATGYELYVDAGTYNGSWIETSFTGSRVKVIAKKDGSKVGAKIYIDGELISEVSTYAAQDSYEEVFDSGELEYAEHTIRIEPTGVFGIDCVQYYTDFSDSSEDRSALVSAVEEYQTLNEDDYSGGWVRFRSALEDAKTIIGTPGYTQDEIDAAVEELNEAAGELTMYAERDLSALKDAIVGALEVVYDEDASDKYDLSLSPEFTDTTFAAVDCLNTRRMQQEDVDSAAAALNTAIEELTSSHPSSPDDNRQSSDSGSMPVAAIIALAAVAVVLVAAIAAYFAVKKKKNKAQ